MNQSQADALRAWYSNPQHPASATNPEHHGQVTVETLSTMHYSSLTGVPFWTLAIFVGSNIAFKTFGGNIKTEIITGALLAFYTGVVTDLVTPQLSKVLPLGMFEVGPTSLATAFMASLLYSFSLHYIGLTRQPMAFAPIFFTAGYIMAVQFAAKFLSASSITAIYSPSSDDGP